MGCSRIFICMGRSPLRPENRKKLRILFVNGTQRTAPHTFTSGIVRITKGEEQL